MTSTVPFPGNTTRSSVTPDSEQKQGEKLLRERMIGGLMGLIFAHVFIAIAIAYSWMDDKNNMHTCWLGLFGAFICSMVFLYHIGISKSGRRASPFLSTWLWILVLTDIAVMAYLQNQAFFQPHAFWAWPSILIVGAIGYLVGPSLDQMSGKLLSSRKAR